MTDRKPLAEVQDKEPVEEPREDKREQTSNEKPINEMQDLQELAVSLGFDHGFNGAGENAEKIYAWAKNFVGEPGGPKVVQHIMNTARMLGTTEKGPSLLRKLVMYASLDTKQSQLQLKKENLIL
jgi:hypothetical protein